MLYYEITHNTQGGYFYYKKNIFLLWEFGINLNLNITAYTMYVPGVGVIKNFS